MIITGRAALYVFCVFLFINAASSDPSWAYDDLFSLPRDSAFESLLRDAPPDTPTAAQDYPKYYYQNCIAESAMPLTPELLKDFCSCSTQYLSDKFSSEELAKLFSDPPLGRKQRRRALFESFAPCMPASIHDSVLDRCLAPGSFADSLAQKEDVCGCVADGIRADSSRETENYAKAYLEYYHKKYHDPLAWYFESRNFHEQNQSWLRRCVFWHEYGWGWRAPE